MIASIECRRADGLGLSACFEEAGAYLEAVRQLWARHVAQGHVMEPEHGRVQVRDAQGGWVATYWLLH